MHITALRNITSVVVSAMCICAVEESARADLPGTLQPGFSIESLDPAPAGDRFLVAPDATAASGFASRLVLDRGLRAFDVRSGSTSLTENSDLTYLHAGVAGGIRNLLLLSMDLPFVLNQSVLLGPGAYGYASSTQTVGTPPESGDLGDWRFGFRFIIPRAAHPRWLDLAVAGDFWASTGDPQNLTGGPAPRARLLALASGGVKVTGSNLAVEYAMGAGYMRYIETSAEPLSLQSIPLRAAVGLRVPSRQFTFRPAVEYAGNVPVSAEDAIHRNTHELFGGFTVSYSVWRLGFHMGTGLSDAPGVPVIRGIVSLGYLGAVSKTSPPAGLH